MKRITLTLCLITLLPIPIYAESPQIVKSEKVTFVLEKVIDDLGIPWGLAFISESQLLITEREGHIKLLDTKTKNLTLPGAPARRSTKL